MKILVADDQPMIVEDIIDELKNLRPAAICIGTSEPSEILPLFAEHRFDIVLLDIDLSGYNGIALAKRILTVKPRTNIIYITGYEKFALDSYKTIASAFLVKPVSTEMIANALDHLRYPVSDITEHILTAQYSGDNYLGKRMVKAREESGMSIQELSDELGVAVQTVYRWERGKRIPDVVTFMHIAKALGVSIEKLLGEES